LVILFVWVFLVDTLFRLVVFRFWFVGF